MTVRVGGTHTYVGRFDSKDEGAVAYNHARRLIDGPDSWVNPIPEGCRPTPEREAAVRAWVEVRLRSSGVAAALPSTPGDAVGRFRANPITGIRGVSRFARRPGFFRASIPFAGQTVTLGYYPTAGEAATAVNVALDFLGCRHIPRNDIPADGGPSADRARVIVALVEGYLRGSRVVRGSGVCPPTVNRHTGYRGVKLHPTSGKWSASIASGSGVVYLGYHPTPHAAAVAHDAAAELLGLPAEFRNRISPGDLPDETGRAVARAKAEAALARLGRAAKEVRSVEVPAADACCQACMPAGDLSLTAGQPSHGTIAAEGLQADEAGPGRLIISTGAALSAASQLNTCAPAARALASGSDVSDHRDVPQPVTGGV